MRKKRFVIVSLVAVGIVLFFGIIIVAVAQICQSELFKTPPKPEITHGEFPFKLEYEINGERKVIEDIWICEFNGYNINEGFGKSRSWKGKLKSNGKDKVVLLKVDEPVKLGWREIPTTQTIYYSPGPARYYMGDMIGAAGIYRHSFPDAFYFEYRFPFSTTQGVIDAETLYEKFGIKLLDWQYTKPIKNTFK